MPRTRSIITTHGALSINFPCAVHFAGENATLRIALTTLKIVSARTVDAGRHWRVGDTG
jgi:hypothetical protein